MNPLTRMNVGPQLFVLLVLMLTPVFVMNGYANLRAEDAIKQQVTGAYVELIKQNHSVIDRDIDMVSKITTTIIQNEMTQKLLPRQEDTVSDRVRAYVDMDRLIQSYSFGVNGGQAVYYWLFVLDPDEYYPFAPEFRSNKPGGVYYLSPDKRPEWFDEAVSKRGRGFLKVIDQYGPDGQKTLAYIRSVNDVTGGNKVVGVLIATNMDKKIQESLDTVSLPQGEIYFTDYQRTLFAGNGFIGSQISVPENEQLAATHEDVWSEIVSDHIYVEHTNSLQQHRLVYKIPVLSLVQQQNELKKTIQRISIVYFLLCFLVMLYFLRSLVRPLQKMAIFLKSYEPGKVMPTSSGIHRRDEVGVLIASLYDMSKRINTLITDKYEMELKHRDAQLQILYEQINPHLLYNTLESISWKSALQGDKETAIMIGELSKLMRIGLSRGRDLIRLEEELEHVRAYLNLQMMRYDYRFRVNWMIEENVAFQLIPKVTLQPLVENAILHGVRQMGEDGEITITARIVNRMMQITVEDNGFKPADPAAIERLLHHTGDNPAGGYGIRNVNRRIQMHFGTEFGLHYYAREPQGIAVNIRLPLSDERSDSNESGGSHV